MTLPSYELEMVADAQRKRLINSIEELKSRARENMDLRLQIRQSPLLASGIAASLALAAGYWAGGLFASRPVSAKQ